MGKNLNNKAARGGRFTPVTAKDTPFAYAEAFKSLRTNLNFLSGTDSVRSVLITSALPDEGKSTTAINLALALAAGGKNVILVECDLRRPALRKYLKWELGKPGLSAYLSGNTPIEECIAQLPEYGISVIGAGAVPANPSELLNTGRMQELIGLLEQNYDFVLLDAPPVTLVTDAAVVGRMTDGAILVVRSRFASARVVRSAKQKLQKVGVRVLGGVITRFDMKKSGWRGGYDYKSYEYGYGQGRGRR